MFISDKFIVPIIVINTIALFMMGMGGQALGPHSLWEAIDYACVWVFIFEALLKIKSWSWKSYWKSGWNRFDFIVVMASLPVVLSPFLDVHDFTSVLVLRVGRMFRLFRLLRFIPNREHLILGIRRAMKASLAIFLALLLVNIILAFLATTLFKNIDPGNFGNPLLSSYSMFKVFTVEGWHELPDAMEASTSGSMLAWTRVFFVFSVLVGGMLGFGLANAVFVDEMTTDNNSQLESKIDALVNEIQELKQRLDERGLGDP